jgi:hypothetical protein
MANQELEAVAGLEVGLPRQRGWICWTILHALIARGLVEKVGRRYRLSASCQRSR